MSISRAHPSGQLRQRLFRRGASRWRAGGGLRIVPRRVVGTDACHRAGIPVPLPHLLLLAAWIAGSGLSDLLLEELLLVCHFSLRSCAKANLRTEGTKPNLYRRQTRRQNLPQSSQSSLSSSWPISKSSSASFSFSSSSSSSSSVCFVSPSSLLSSSLLTFPLL